MRFLLITLSLIFTHQLFARNIMISSHPFNENQKQINTQVIKNYAGGSDSNYVHVLYLHQFTKGLNVDAGFGFSSGDERRRIFMGSTYTFFPDYAEQPNISVKAFYESVRDEDQYVNSVGLAPIMSKGFLVGNVEVYPFFSIPIKLALENETDQYEFQTSMALGTTIPILFQGFENSVVNVESNLDLRNSSSSIAAGITMSFQ